MGLDMYLTKETYIGAYYDFNKVKGSIEIEVNGKPLEIDLNKLSSITERVGYWRKANAIHNWFVKNVQDGIDECQESIVTMEQLKQLQNDCLEIMEYKDKASEILPTQKGFFFGNIEYNEYYFQDIEHTLSILDSVITDEPNSSIDIIYQASW